MSYFDFKMHQIRSPAPLGELTALPLGAHSAPPEPLAGFKGPVLLLTEGEGGEGKRGRGRGRGGKRTPSITNFWLCHWRRHPQSSASSWFYFTVTLYFDSLTLKSDPLIWFPKCINAVSLLKIHQIFFREIVLTIFRDACTHTSTDRWTKEQTTQKHHTSDHLMWGGHITTTKTIS